MNALGQQVANNVRVSLSGGPKDSAVALAVYEPQIAALLVQDLQYVEASESGGDVDGALAVRICLVDVDRSHGEQRLQALQVVLLDRAEDRGQDEVALLQNANEN